MNLLSFLSRRGTAPVARERLQILLAHERTAFGRSDLVAVLREEILAVIAKHVAIDQDKVKITMERGDAVSTLEIDVELPKTLNRAA
ncbi:cell division topological specificity factor [Methylobacterium indicum]|uniref:Cell division topological specificity factor n=1 Tax=Methylobacterium indicum TaxID=1775910 RepID=A0ABR5H0J8_9HYPH|nr:cell division topological specificity factor MinE [Methylobacterium indicum]KMO14327.1 cell division topological specificity factor [Methylobacterium indicum]KMO16483.1 cell division topological specificity factor [Methylobacterium indicum]KTS29314.1 cell division topological specificity factor [Methylobacterium indicum]KTS48297.1 cell division topological specificity factor [Methylobacterium indicum]